jgi:hypothetical protein
MADDRPVPGEGEGDLDDRVLDELRRSNPVDMSALPSSRSTKAATTLEQVLRSDDESFSDESFPDESSPSPAGNQGGREGPPPRPTSR